DKGCWVCWGMMVEGSGKSWVMVGRQEKKGEWCYRNGENSGEMNSGFKSCMTGMIV
nr:hypothetical protein [Tanacetum cinerariifolium]